jgi:CRP-like cAMP-binding protein
MRLSTLVDLAAKSRWETRRAGSLLFKAGDPLQEALYLVQGEIELQDPNGVPLGRLAAGSREAAHRLAHQSPRRVSALCVSDVVCIAVDVELLDMMLTWDQTDTLQVGEVVPGTVSHDDDWMTRLLQMRSFQIVPPANLQTIFMRMQRVDVGPGQLIVKQGDIGDYFYVIIQGRAIVTRDQPNQKQSLKLAELEPGQCFGEEALIADEPRNANVTMLTQGALMRLAKEDFRTLLRDPATRRIGTQEAEAMIRDHKARYLDVRLPSEFQNRNLDQSFSVPLYMLRAKLAQLSADTSYICVCDTGRRSAVAAFVLMQKGYDAFVLDPSLNRI